LEQAVRGARLLSISFVQYLSGYRADLRSIGEICQRHSCLFCVDAIQGMGAFPLDVRACRIHALAADGHKWITGPEGCGVLYVSRELQDRVDPVEFGWTNVAHFNDYAKEGTLRSDAGRYECGSLNTIGIFGLRAAIEFLLQIGVDRIAPVVQDLGNRIADGVVAKGYQLLGTRTTGNGAGIVSFRHPTIDARKIVRDLEDLGFIAAPRQGWIRTSPHFYIATDEIARFVEALP
jgi:selenocysteine lyase/cysteine desulfurase